MTSSPSFRSTTIEFVCPLRKCDALGQLLDLELSEALCRDGDAAARASANARARADERRGSIARA
jgi:hypothetical protein